MTADLTTTVRTAYHLIDADQEPVTVEEVIRRTDSLQPATASQSDRNRLVTAGLVTLGAAAVVLALLAPALWLTSNTDSGPVDPGASSTVDEPPPDSTSAIVVAPDGQPLQVLVEPTGRQVTAVVGGGEITWTQYSDRKIVPPSQPNSGVQQVRIHQTAQGGYVITSFEKVDEVPRYMTWYSVDGDSWYHWPISVWDAERLAVESSPSSDAVRESHCDPTWIFSNDSQPGYCSELQTTPTGHITFVVDAEQAGLSGYWYSMDGVSFQPVESPAPMSKIFDFGGMGDILVLSDMDHGLWIGVVEQ